ncbi:MAG: R3H domain-containing nucleic acid-binding protein [Acidobacteriota bacterium]
MSQRFEGRNLEEALQNAAQTFGVERWQLTYHVLLEKRGFLGGMKRIVVEADVNTEAPPPANPPAPAPAPAAEPRPPRAERAPRPAGRGGRDGGGGRSRDRDGGRGRGRGEQRERGPRRELRTGDFETFLGDVPEQTVESEAAKLVRDWIEGVVFLAKIDVVLRTAENDTQILVRLYGSDGSRLTDRNGELLDAIQVLANKALVGRKVEKEIELDCEDFKTSREQDLVRRASEVADRVRESGREELLPPMSPIERRIVHIALREDADVTTDSRGEGFYKRVAIIPRPPETAPETAPEP